MRDIYRAKNREKLLIAKAEYYSVNKYSISIKQAEYRIENLDRVTAKQKEWRSNNKERVAATKAAWKITHPTECLSYRRNRTAKRRGANGKLSKGLSDILFKLQQGKCPCCKLPLGGDYHLDHKMPLALGGANEDFNMQLLRAECNLNKSSKHPVDFMQSRGFLL